MSPAGVPLTRPERLVVHRLVATMHHPPYHDVDDPTDTRLAEAEWFVLNSQALPSTCPCPAAQSWCLHRIAWAIFLRLLARRTPGAGAQGFAHEGTIIEDP